MRFLGRHPRQPPAPYVIRSPYGEARAQLLSRRPTAGDDAPGTGRLLEIVIDAGLDADLISVYLLADGTISVYSAAGIHSTGLRGAPRVVEAAAAIRDEVTESLGAFRPVDDVAELPLPDRGHSQVLVRTGDGDLAASDRDGHGHGTVGRLAAMALLLTQLARAALVEGFDRVEAGETAYRIAPEYRRIRSTLLDWVPAPDHLAADALIAGVAVEIGDAATGTVTSLFAFADGSISLWRSDGTLAEGLSDREGVAEAARALLDSVDAARPAFVPAWVIPLPQPGRAQFVIRARRDGAADWTELAATASVAELADPRHPLAPAFTRATEVLRIAE